MTPTDWKKDLLEDLLTAPEIWTGVVMIAVGLLALAAGVPDLLVRALAPFGAGLILSEIAGRAARGAHARVKVRAKRDD